MKFRLTAVSICALMGVASPAIADDHGTHAEAEHAKLDLILASDIRAEDTARDDYRHPGSTLRFFGIKPGMAVGEYGPGGGWYTRILAPYIAETGTYVGLGPDVERYFAGADEDRIARAKAWPETFPGQVTEWTGLDADLVTAYELDETPEEAAGTMDAILVFRSFHGLFTREMADSVVTDFYGLLKPGGVVGVVQHRAKEDAPYDYTRGANGYLKQSELTALFESQGFTLVATTDINANPQDPANWDGGVWTLPPVLRYGEENKEQYLAIGESDRMTLLFRKPVEATSIPEPIVMDDPAPAPDAPAPEDVVVEPAAEAIEEATPSEDTMEEADEAAVPTDLETEGDGSADMVEEAAEDTMDAAEDTGAMETAEDMIESAADGVEDAGESVEPTDGTHIVEAVEEDVTEVIESVDDMAGDAVEGAMEAAEEVADDAVEDVTTTDPQ